MLWGWTEVRRLKVSVSKVKRWENGVTDVLWLRNIQRYLTRRKYDHCIHDTHLGICMLYSNFT